MSENLYFQVTITMRDGWSQEIKINMYFNIGLVTIATLYDLAFIPSNIGA